MTKVSFPIIGSYDIPALYLLTHALNVTVIKPPPITSKTINLGVKYSPDFVCTPFKYTLGTMIESIDKGADTLIQLGGGCRYGYYASLQEKILLDLDYKIKVFNLVTAGKPSLRRITKIFKEIDPDFKKVKLFYYGFITLKMVKYMDKIDDYIRENGAFEIEKNSFKNLREEMLKEFSKTKGIINLYKTYKRYLEKLKKIKIQKPDNYLKVGVIGELYTLMEPFANNDLERILMENKISIKRYTTATYLLLKKKNIMKKVLKKLKIIKYNLGADAADNVYNTKVLCDNNYDGIIHLKSAFCTPEIGVMPIISKIADSKDVPVLFLTFDSSASEVGVRTRLEAFFDMLEMRRDK